jgi:tRNA dimethylallyltransferase
MKTPSPAKGPLVAIVGPTAAGKTALSVRLAQAVGGEVVSADSRQVYRGMDIGTAKATPEEQAGVPHHLLDVVEPDQVLSLAEFQALAYAAIDDVLEREGVPLLVGGTGQYAMAVLEGWQIPAVAPDETLRQELYRQAEREGMDALHARLAALDPAAAGHIDARNVRRVIRALEVYLTTGRPISEQQDKAPPPYRIRILGLQLPRAVLYERIDRRVEAMMAAGLEEEVRGLVDAGYGFDLPAMSGVGYGQFRPYLAGEGSLDEVVQAIERATRRFVRHQANWFRRDDPRIHWLDAETDPFEPALRLVQDLIAPA